MSQPQPSARPVGHRFRPYRTSATPFRRVGRAWFHAFRQASEQNRLDALTG
jgi:hypothetical protein